MCACKVLDLRRRLSAHAFLHPVPVSTTGALSTDRVLKMALVAFITLCSGVIIFVAALSFGTASGLAVYSYLYRRSSFVYQSFWVRASRAPFTAVRFAQPGSRSACRTGPIGKNTDGSKWRNRRHLGSSTKYATVYSDAITQAESGKT